jgi:diguanylate cyclase (GGDEF)-like protein
VLVLALFQNFFSHVVASSDSSITYANHSNFYWLALLYGTLSLIWLIRLRTNITNTDQRISIIVADCFAYSGLIVFSGGNSVIFLFIYILVVLDNGFRFGKNCALIAAISTMFSFLVMLNITPYWDNHFPLWLGAFFGIGILGIYTGILSNTLSEETKKLEMMATRDSLTNLPNRRLFMEHLERSMNASERDKTYCACIFIDLDGFKKVNDTLGHGIGDALLIEVSECISHHLRDTDLVARFGGDEFAIAAQCFAVPTDAIVVARRVLKGIESIKFIQGNPIEISASMGIGWFNKAPGSIVDADNMIDNADKAMYAAKKAGKHCLMVIDTQGEILSAKEYLSEEVM